MNSFTLKLTKYLALAKQSWQSNLTYRVDFIFWGFSELLANIAWFFIWLIVYKDRPPIAGYTLTDTVTYFILIGVLSIFTQTYIDNRLSRLITSGELNNVLLKPIGSIWSIVVKVFSESVPDILIRVFAYAGLLLIFKEYWFFPSWINFTLFCLGVVLGVVWHYLFSLTIGCLGFWTVRTEGLAGTFRTIGYILGGVYAPLVFFPQWFQTLASVLPFQYERYFAVSIYLEKLTFEEIVSGFMFQLAWVGLFALILKILWIKGLRQYDSVGI